MQRKEGGIFISDEELKQGFLAVTGIGAGVIVWKVIRCILLAPSGC